ncbi:KdsC family phosphatase [Phytohalomonas tamaricis]|uniref:KdsC family phosphatase n=1 Tax=Phytohalomonas tamaricis TaxID=2081032 RepID=UPI0021D40B99|nr:HAD hydrolase family protein [Phytohalomonas tamaricis]
MVHIPVSAEILTQARTIKLLALDVDGVLTDGRLHYQDDGRESKSFNILDGQGIRLLIQSGVSIAIITGRESSMVSRRAQELGIAHVHQKCKDKWTVLTTLADELGLELKQIAYCGDDLPDLYTICHVGLGLSVPNAPEYIRSRARYVTQQAGGQGAVREICELIIQAQGGWDAIMAHYQHEQH